jgi:hypothetical protein
MIEIGRRGFFTGLAALVAAPAIIRVAPLMKISVMRHMPLYVPASWLNETIRNGVDLESHGWSRPMADNWINLYDFDPAFAAKWAATDLVEQRATDVEVDLPMRASPEPEPEYWFS